MFSSFLKFFESVLLFVYFVQMIGYSDYTEIQLFRTVNKKIAQKCE